MRAASNIIFGLLGRCVKTPSPGKVSIEFLKRFVFGKLGASRQDTVQGPGVGRDFAVTKYGDVWVISSTDPVTGSRTFLGRIAVNVATNDVAVSGIEPGWLSIAVLMPLGMELRKAKRLFSDIHQQARKLGVAVVGGHTEYVSYIPKPIVVATAIGASRKRPKLPSDVRPGDFILMGGELAIEGTAILAAEKRKELMGKGIASSLLTRAERLVFKTSVLKLALELGRFDCVKSMHDPTEGGLVGGLYEMSVAADLGFKVDLDDVPVRRETEAIVDALRLDPYRLISSGSILVSCSPRGINEVLAKFRGGDTHIKVIGRFTERADGCVISSKGKSRAVTDAPSDELWRAIG